MDIILQLLADGLIAGCLYALCAVGWSVIYSTTFHFHVAHGAVFVVAGYMAWVAQTKFGSPLWFAFTFGTLAGTIVGVLVDVIIYQPLKRVGGDRISIFIASLGLMVVIENIIVLIFGTDPRLLNVGTLSDAVKIGPVYITRLRLIVLGATVVFMLIFLLFMKYSRIGRAIRGISSSPLMAATVGINLHSTEIATYLLGSLISAPVGVFMAMDVGATPFYGIHLVLLATVAVIAGGIGSHFGALLGGLMLGLIENAGIWKIPSQWQEALLFGVFLVFILVRPNGIFGRRTASVHI